MMKGSGFGSLPLTSDPAGPKTYGSGTLDPKDTNFSRTLSTSSAKLLKTNWFRMTYCLVPTCLV